MNFIPTIARLFVSVIFLQAGYNHVRDFGDSEQAIADVGLPLPGLMEVLMVIFLLVGAFSLILGYKIQIGAAMLIVFTVPATVLFHNFIQDSSQLIDFEKNVGLVGALLVLIYTGAGPLSLDAVGQSDEPSIQQAVVSERTPVMV